MWTKAKNPKDPAEPVFHHPDRCLNCGHLSDDHADEVGCTVEGGTKYITDDKGIGIEACSCEKFVPVPSVDPSVKGVTL